MCINRPFCTTCSRRHLLEAKAFLLQATCCSHKKILLLSPDSRNDKICNNLTVTSLTSTRAVPGSQLGSFLVSNPLLARTLSFNHESHTLSLLQYAIQEQKPQFQALCLGGKSKRDS